FGGNANPNLDSEGRIICESLIRDYCNNVCSNFLNSPNFCEQSGVDLLFFPYLSNYSSCNQLVSKCDNSSASGGQSQRDGGTMASTSSRTIDELEPAVFQCEADAQTVEPTCSKVPDGFWSTLTMIVDQASQQIVNSGVDPCSGLYQKASAAQSALAAARTTCVQSYQNCSQSCARANDELSNLQRLANSGSLPPSWGGRSSSRSLRSEINQFQEALSSYQQRVQSARATCQKGRTHVAEISNNLNKINQAMNSAGQCAMQISSQGKTLKTFDQCRADFNQPGCEIFRGMLPSSGSCQDPKEAQSNIVCICRANSLDPRCSQLHQIGQKPTQGGSLTADGTPSSLGGGGSSSQLLNQHLGVGAFGGDSEYDPGSARTGQNNTPSVGGGGGGVGFFGGSTLSGNMGDSSGNKGKGKAGGKDPGTKKESNFLSSLVKSGGGLAQFFNRLAGRKSANEGGVAGGGLGGKPDEGLKADGDQALSDVDLTRFLPNGHRIPARFASSATGPDGITGPFSDNFKKINQRFFILGPSLTAIP
ncbi:MAG: hypothetical protein NZ480_08780, partial [Bdellovibrionaceae bacterium]|nr:hypothetical protein [Pseudobdellovibrionaceae bacterium]